MNSIDLLKSKKLKATPFRLEVLDIFQEQNFAINVKIIEERLVNFDRITLFRTIKSFIEAGIIHEIAIAGEEKKLAICPPECTHTDKLHTHNHIHLNCKICKQVVCVDLIEKPNIKISEGIIDGLEITATGVCKNCLS